MKVAEPQYLFVYGTLRPDSPHPMARVLRRHARPVGPARFRGRLYRVSWYPGARDAARPTDAVFGELYRLTRAGPCLEALDAYEGDEFTRVRRQVSTARGTRDAWLYLFTGPTEQLQRIPGGHFRPGPRGAHTR